MKVDTAEVVKATGGTSTTTWAHKVKHRRCPSSTPRLPVRRSAPVGDAWLFDRRAGMVVTPLVAATLAHWGHLEVEEVRPEATSTRSEEARCLLHCSSSAPSVVAGRRVAAAYWPLG
jgi:hypothetical protein